MLLKPPLGVPLIQTLFMSWHYTNIVLLDTRCPIAALFRECAQLLLHPVHLSFVVLTSSSRREVALLSGRDKYSCLQVMSHQNTSIFLFLCTFMARLLTPPQGRRDIRQRGREREREKAYLRNERSRCRLWCVR